MIVDLGCGDGRAAARAAAADPRALVIGIDANAAPMAGVSRRAARTPRKGGLPNLLFVVAAAERLPPELASRADELRILFPWGSLLRGVLGLEPDATAGIAALLRPGACLTAFVSVTPRDGVAGLAELDDRAIAGIADRIERHDLHLVDAARATAAELRSIGSTWGRRLAADPRRPVWRLRVVRGHEECIP